VIGKSRFVGIWTAVIYVSLKMTIIIQEGYLHHGTIHKTVTYYWGIR
jgi:hypothetical protein